MATIITKNSSTASSVPLAANMTQGELAVNVTDKRLFTENASGVVVELGTTPSSLAATGAVTGSNLSGTNTGDLVSGSTIKTVNSATLLGSGDIALQTVLVSGTSLKTINSTSLLGSGDISISGITPQTVGFTATGGTTPKTFTGDVDLTASAVVTLTGTQTLTNKTITTPLGIVKGDVALGNVDNTSDATKNSAVASFTNKTNTDIVYTLTGTTPAFTATNGAVQTWTLTAASSPTNSLTSGQSIILVTTPGANAITWPTTVWTKQGGSGAAPTLFTAGKTIVVLWMVGTVLYGSHLGDTV